MIGRLWRKAAKEAAASEVKSIAQYLRNQAADTVGKTLSGHFPEADKADAVAWVLELAADAIEAGEHKL